MTYIDGYLLAVPAANRERFRTMATSVGEVFIANGALRVVENWGDDVPDGKITDLKRAVQLKDGEVVCFSWVEWPSKEARDKGNDAIATDPRRAEIPEDKDLMDSTRMIYGGFLPVVDLRADGKEGGA